MSFRVVVAPDKFKGSLTATQSAEAMAVGVREALPDAQVDCVPMADGGEGTVEALVVATGGSFLRTTVTGPLGTPVVARYGLLGDGRTAVIEMAAASGLVLLSDAERDPLRATTRGTGELLLAALNEGVNRVILGIGGSATNDGGAGLAQALGYRLLDPDGYEIPPGGGGLDKLSQIDPSGRDPRLADVRIDVACDVDNPLCGPTGASAVYGPQKGADAEAVATLDSNLAHLARIVTRDLGQEVADLPGAGAAGGLGAGLVVFAGGRLLRGVELVIEAVGLAGRLRAADLCLTGEGSIDASSAHGKTAVGVARLAHSFGCPTFALVGTIGPGADSVRAEGIDAIFSICPGPITAEVAMRDASRLLERSAGEAIRAFLAGRASKPLPSGE